MGLRGNQSTTRHLNRRLILNLLRREGELSRVALAGATGLSPAAITGVVGELIEEGLVIPASPGESSGGRKPIPVRLNYEGQNCLGIKLSDNGVDVSITDMAANPLDSCRIELSRPSPDQATDAIGKAADKLLKRRHGSARLAGVGIAMPGTIDVQEGVCRYANHLS